MTARAIAMVNTCMYDAWAPYDKKPQAPCWATACAAQCLSAPTPTNSSHQLRGLHRAAVDLFPTRKAAFDAVLTSQGFDPANTSTDVATPAGVGNTTCQALLDFRHHDGANQLGDLAPALIKITQATQPSNTPTQINDPNHWQPLVVGGAITALLGAQWFKVTPLR